MSDVINITVYDSRSTQMAAERAERAAQSVENYTENLIDPTPPGTEADPAVIPPGPEGKKGKFAPSPGFYEGFPEVTADKRWYFYWNGSSWSLIDMGELPQNIVKDEVIGNTEAVSGTGVEKYSLPITTARALPVGSMFLEDDRPDMIHSELILIDQNGLMVELITDGSNKILPRNFSYVLDDRPDAASIGVILVDSNNYYIPQTGYSSGADIDNLLTFKDFGEMQGYAVETVKDPNDYWQLWEDMRDSDPTYVTRTAMRPSSFLDLPIWRYEFKPKSPKVKIMMIGCAHGWEKNISFGWARLMNQLVNNWRGNDALTFIRQNVHFVTLPLLSPDNFVVNPFNGLARTRSRQNYETKWIPASFVASGSEINITFAEADFPTNELHSFSNYFQERKTDIEGKIGITVIDSTDTSAVSHNAVYRLKTVNGVGDITLTNDESVTGSVSGTLKFCVRVDPERNYPTKSWDNFSSGTPTSQPLTYYDNKGTKPVSTNENANAVQVIQENQDISTLLDLHSGAGDYVTYIDPANRSKSFAVLNDMFESLFNVDANLPTSGNPMSNIYVSELLGIAASLPEWHSSEPPAEGLMTDEQATELHQWLGNILYVESIRSVNNKR